MTPPEGKNIKEDQASRTYYRDRLDRYKDRRSEGQDTSDSHTSKYWDSYGYPSVGYGLKDNYGYGSDDYNYRNGYDVPNSGYYPALERQLGGSGCGPGSGPGYREAFMDPSFALGIFVVGAFATYLLYNALETAGIGRELSANVLLGDFVSGKKMYFCILKGKAREIFHSLEW